VLNTIIKPIDKLLRQRAKTRLNQGRLGDDNNGGITNLLAYVDDLNCVIPHEDTYFFCKTFETLANNIGLRLNNNKSTILTNISNKSIIPLLSNDNKIIIKKSLREFTENKETTDGIVILGFPIGNEKFINEKLNKISHKVTSCFKILENNLSDIQTIGQIFCTSLIPKFYYTLCADVFVNGEKCNNIFDYDSEHCQKINNLFTQTLQFLTVEEIIPPHVKELTERPISQNGLHIFNPCKSAITASCSPVLKSIQIAKKGIPIKKEFIKLPQSITSIYSDWIHQDNSIFNTLKKHIKQIMCTLDKKINDQMNKKQIKQFSYEAPAHLIHEKIMHEAYNINKDEIFRKTPPNSRHVLPSILA
jgi:rRNA-processing protein FCF1